MILSEKKAATCTNTTWRCKSDANQYSHTGAETARVLPRGVNSWAARGERKGLDVLLDSLFVRPQLELGNCSTGEPQWGKGNRGVVLEEPWAELGLLAREGEREADTELHSGTQPPRFAWGKLGPFSQFSKIKAEKDTTTIPALRYL